MLKIIRVLAFLLIAQAAHATVTIRNFFTDGSAVKNKVVRLDVNGNRLDVTDGQVIQDVNDPTSFYRIGRASDCGDKWQHHSTPFCGFKSYKTKDFLSSHYYDQGYMFDASGPIWQARCKNAAATYDGCFRPHMIYNAASSKWKLWVNVSAAAPRYVVLESPGCPTSPSTCIIGPYTEVGTVDLGAVGDFDLFLDGNGDGYLVFTDAGSGFDIKLTKLNAAFTAPTGSVVTVKSGAGTPDYEAPAMFKKGSTYHVAYGLTCALCANTDTSIVSNTGDPISGTWTQGATLNPNSCGGQLGGVTRITIGGTDYHQLWTDQWKAQNPNDTTRIFGYRLQAQAGFFETVLSFTGDTPNAFTCDDTYTLPLTADATNNDPAGLLASSVASNYTSFCDIRDNTYRYQSFTVTSTINTLPLFIFKGPVNGSVCDDTICPDISVDLRIVIHTDSSGLPGATLQTIDLDKASIGFSLRRRDVAISSLQPGIYGYSMRPASAYAGNGAYCFAYNDGGSNYSGGAAAASFNGGSTWAIEAGGFRDLMFQATGAALNIIRIQGPAELRLAPGTTFSVH